MTTTLCWKEYREQRGIWLAIVVAAVLLAVSVGVTAKQGLWQLDQDPETRTALAFILISLVAGHGVVCGAQQLAGEKETGTEAFLNMLTPERELIWQTKAGVGCLLTLTQSQILAGLAVFLQILPGLGMAAFPALALLSVFGLSWGLAGGAWCRFVLPAIVSGAALMIAGLTLMAALPPYLWPVLLLGLGGLAVFLSRQSFCQFEKPRQKIKKGLAVPRLLYLSTGPFRRWLKSEFDPCWWLAVRQGRWVMASCLAASLVGGFLLLPAYFTFYPIVSLTAGLVCGLAVFASEQVGEQERFLGSQRFPPGLLWFSKSCVWLLVSIATIMLLSLPFLMRLQSDRGLGSSAVGILGVPLGRRPFVLGFLWPIYGFACGQFFMLLSRRIIVAAVAAAFTSLVVLALWLPSLLFGGVSVWQLLAVPLALLVAVRLSLWPWLCGRVYSRGHVLGLAGCVLFVAAWLGGSLWYQAVEIPDVGEPFDVKAYEDQLDRAARSGAANLLKKAASGLRSWRQQVASKLGPPTRLPFPIPADRRDQTQPPQLDYGRFCDEIFEKGWPPNDAEVGQWLDAVFAGDWVQELRKGTELPLGLLTDPRRMTWHWHFTDLDNLRSCAVLLRVRAMQLQQRGDVDGSLEQLAVLLALSRQLRHHAVSPQLGEAMRAQDSALSGLDSWLSACGPDAKRVRKGLDLLLRHEQESPDPRDNDKARYLSIVHQFESSPYDKPGFWLEERVYEVAAQAPWERQRRHRLLSAVFQAREAEHGLPLADGPTRLLSPSHWERILHDTSDFLLIDLGMRRSSDLQGLRRLHAQQLVAALALYEVDNGKPAAKLDDLVPDYLAHLPLDPVQKKSFSYLPALNENTPSPGTIAGAIGMLSPPRDVTSPLAAVWALAANLGSEITGVFPDNMQERQTRRLLPGQGLIWVELAEREARQLRPDPNMPEGAVITLKSGVVLRSRPAETGAIKLYFVVPHWRE